MYLIGFAEEPAPDIEGQIRATQELGGSPSMVFGEMESNDGKHG